MKVTPTKNNQCVLYLRYSSTNQKELSIEYQRYANTKYAKDNGLEIVDEYVDEAYSALSDNRPEFQRLVGDVKSKPSWKIILVYDLSRYSRNTLDSFTYRDVFADNGIRVISVTLPLLEDTPETRMIEGINYVCNEYASRKTAAASHAAQCVKARAALHCGGCPPLGYDLDAEGHLVINEDEADTVRKIFSLYLLNYSYEKIARLLNQEGRKTKANNFFNKNSFSSILTQEKYCGKYIWNQAAAKNSKRQRNSHAKKPLEEQIIVPGGCPAIISETDFQKVQKKMEERKNGTATSKSKYHYMLGGLGFLKCGCCGRHMTGTVHRSKKYAYVKYQCPNHKGGGCPTKELSADTLDYFVSKVLAQQLLSKRVLPELAPMLQTSLDSREYKRLQNKVTGLDRSIQNLTKALGSTFSDAIVQNIASLEAQKTTIQTQLVKAHTAVEIPTEANLNKYRQKLAKALRKSDDPAVRDLLQTTIQEIRITNDNVMIDYTI